ncbi:endonuclease/exonuclease/phosphatase family protein [Leptolyngbya sp. PCC 6406]|uniref:endonuclease/exonuclease/phosphatase family protein n=1 Tax=Leptolyngbya sp. PCC 6406 TaxID=1173264 RepID=UPI0002ABEC37|nr:endonuclease/exonuclease/phosphatase family protein [Leptolyngbya sp. PCC 6406]
MVAFLFWNINKNKATLPLIADIGELYSIDIILLAECTIEPGELLSQLNHGRDNKYFYFGFSRCEKIVVLTRFNEASFIRPVAESSRVTIRHLQMPGLIDILIAGTHHISKNHSSPTSQYSMAEELSRLIKDAEKNVGHSRTVLVGDLNMNPFEEGLVSAGALHAVSSQQIALRNTRKVQGTEYPFFYNPMWNFLADVHADPPGTYYYCASDHMSYFWNVFDQVLIRPDLINRFAFQNLKRLLEIGTTSLLSGKGIPRKNVYSDHLPIIFSLDL